MDYFVKNIGTEDNEFQFTPTLAAQGKEYNGAAFTITVEVLVNGAEYNVNPSATVAGLSQYLWELEQPASAVANGCFIGAINRVGTEEPWNIGKFYGSTYVVNPRGKIEAQLGEDEDGLLVHDMDMDMVREIRNLWQFFRDRRPEFYEDLVELR